MADHTRHSRYGKLDQDYVARLYGTEEADEGPFLMLNLMRYRPWADYPEDADGAGDRPVITDRQADDRYAPLEVLADGRVLVDLLSDTDLSVDVPDGQLLLSVEGTPLGDGRTWRALRLTGLPDGSESTAHLDEGVAAATTVAVLPLLNALP